MLVMSLILAVLQLAFAVHCFRMSARPFARVLGFLGVNVLLVLLGGFCMLGSPAAMLHAALLTIAMVGALTAKATPRRFIVYAAICTVLAYTGATAIAMREPLERMRLRNEYPIESLSERLAYESRRTTQSFAAGPSAAAELSQPRGTAKARVSSSLPRGLQEFEERLENDEPRIPWRGNRARALAQIHESQVEYFVNSPGFGVTRMAPRSPVEDAEIAPPSSITLAISEPCDADATAPHEAAGGRDQTPSPADPPSPDRLRRMHVASAVDFVNARGWGYVQDRDHVAGFQVHHFRKTPSLDESTETGRGTRPTAGSRRSLQQTPGQEDGGNEEWLIAKVELVSLLAHDEPCAYVTAELPRMDKIAEAPVRPLTPFETRALVQLQADEDVVQQASLNRIEMLGAIRAAQQCLKCHQVQRGELLGAFSYVLDRARPVRRQPGPSEPAY